MGISESKAVVMENVEEVGESNMADAPEISVSEVSDTKVEPMIKEEEVSVAEKTSEDVTEVITEIVETVMTEETAHVPPAAEPETIQTEKESTIIMEKKNPVSKR